MYWGDNAASGIKSVSAVTRKTEPGARVNCGAEWRGFNAAAITKEIIRYAGATNRVLEDSTVTRFLGKNNHNCAGVVEKEEGLPACLAFITVVYHTILVDTMARIYRRYLETDATALANSSRRFKHLAGTRYGHTLREFSSGIDIEVTDALGAGRISIVHTIGIN